jgi:predicted dehydrogenase
MIKRAGDLLVPKINFTEPLRAEMQHFAECVQTRATPLSDAASGIAVTAVLQAADRSIAENGAPVPVEIPQS